MKRLNENELVILDDLDQDSPEWLEWRRKGIGSSDVALLMSPKPVFDRTIGTLWKQKIGYERAVQVNNPHVKRGKMLEPKIRDKVNAMLGTQFSPTCLFRRDAPYLRASLDGLDLGADVLLEIKAPADKAFAKYLQDFPKIPENYYYQMQYQMLVSDVEYGIFSFYNEQTDENGELIHPEPYIIPIENNYNLQLDIERRCHLFWRAVSEKIPIGFVNDELKLFYQKPTVVAVIMDKKQLRHYGEREFILPKLSPITPSKGSGVVPIVTPAMLMSVKNNYPSHDLKIISLTDNPFGKAGEATLDTLDEIILRELTASSLG